MLTLLRKLKRVFLTSSKTSKDSYQLKSQYNSEMDFMQALMSNILRQQNKIEAEHSSQKPKKK
jgi:hypothetical protein